MPQLLITWRVKGLDAAAQSVNNNGRCPSSMHIVILLGIVINLFHYSISSDKA